MEVMNLATDAILKVKDAELKAKEILEKAHKDALILKEEAKEKVKKSYDEAIKNAKKYLKIYPLMTKFTNLPFI